MPKKNKTKRGGVRDNTRRRTRTANSSRRSARIPAVPQPQLVPVQQPLNLPPIDPPGLPTAPPVLPMHTANIRSYSAGPRRGFPNPLNDTRALSRHVEGTQTTIGNYIKAKIRQLRIPVNSPRFINIMDAAENLRTSFHYADQIRFSGRIQTVQSAMNDYRERVKNLLRWVEFPADREARRQEILRLRNLRRAQEDDDEDEEEDEEDDEEEEDEDSPLPANYQLSPIADIVQKCQTDIGEDGVPISIISRDPLEQGSVVFLSDGHCYSFVDIVGLYNSNKKEFRSPFNREHKFTSDDKKKVKAAEKILNP
jgi:hypothetical protein